jgi:hypothetical protein
MGLDKNQPVAVTSARARPPFRCGSRSVRRDSSTTGANARALWDLRQGECIAALSLVPDGFADVVITDPPDEAESPR